MSEVPEHQGRQVQSSIRIDAPAEKVWEAWVDPERIAQWFVDFARDRAVTGGSVTWGFQGFGEFAQKVIVADANRRLVLQAFPGALVEITLERKGGSTVLTLVQSGFADGAEWDEPMAGVGSGWDLSIALLKEYVEHHYGKQKRSFMVARPSALPPLEARDYFVNEQLLSQWLTINGAPAPPGESFELKLREGAAIKARTTAITSREVSFALEDADVVIDLKAFAGSVMGPGPAMVGIRAMAWGDDQRMNTLELYCTSAVERLAKLLSEQPAIGG